MLVVWLTDYAQRFTIETPDGIVPLFPNDQFATFVLTATIGSFAVELVYLILAVFAFRLVPAAGNQWWQYAIVAVAVVTPILGFYGALNPDPHGRSNYNWEAMYWTLALILVALAWFAFLVMTRRDRVDRAAAHAAEHHGVPPLDETLEYGPAS